MKRILIALFVISALVLWYCFLRDTKPEPQLVWHGLTCRQIQDVFTDRDAEESGQRVLKAHSTSLQIKVVQRKISQEEAVQHYKGIETSLLSYYVPRASPYIGLLTRQSDCPENFRPKKLSSEENAPHMGLMMYANSRFSPGVCAENEIAYSMLQFIIYCPGRSFEVTAFDRSKDFKLLAGIFHSCGCQ